MYFFNYIKIDDKEQSTYNIFEILESFLNYIKYDGFSQNEI